MELEWVLYFILSRAILYRALPLCVTTECPHQLSYISRRLSVIADSSCCCRSRLTDWVGFYGTFSKTRRCRAFVWDGLFPASLPGTSRCKRTRWMRFVCLLVSVMPSPKSNFPGSLVNSFTLWRSDCGTPCTPPLIDRSSGTLCTVGSGGRGRFVAWQRSVGGTTVMTDAVTTNKLS